MSNVSEKQKYEFILSCVDADGHDLWQLNKDGQRVALFDGELEARNYMVAETMGLHDMAQSHTDLLRQRDALLEAARHGLVFTRAFKQAVDGPNSNMETLWNESDEASLRSIQAAIDLCQPKNQEGGK